MFDFSILGDLTFNVGMFVVWAIIGITRIIYLYAELGHETNDYKSEGELKI